MYSRKNVYIRYLEVYTRSHLASFIRGTEMEKNDFEKLDAVTQTPRYGK